MGYVGNIVSQWIDYKLLLHLVTQNTDVEFEFIGPVKGSNLGEYDIHPVIRQLQSMEHTHFTGSLGPSDLAQALRRCDLFLMCYRGDEFPDRLSNSHKVLEYLSTGRVAVCNYTAQYDNGQQLLNMVTKNSMLPDLFRQTIDQIEIHNSLERRTQRHLFAMSQTYLDQVARITAIIQQFEPERFGVVGSWRSQN